MDGGTKVYKAYISAQDDRLIHWIDEGTVTEIVVDGNPVVRMSDVLVPLDGRWRTTRVEAQRDVHAALVRHIGGLQAKADEMADQILHATLTTEEAAA
jgi:multidrug resistance efflux pump